MSNFMGVGIFWIGLNRADLDRWRLTLKPLVSLDRFIKMQMYKLLFVLTLFFA